jgi:hypothetical protein
MAGAPSSSGGGSKKSWKAGPAWLRFVWIVLLFAGTILVVSLVVLLYFGDNDESKHVNKDANQAVFLTNGQVYFGKINDVNEEFMDLRGIYYLNVSQPVQPEQDGDSQQSQNNITLVKLGCELHGPVDQMIINRDQITFWENLKSDGQVSKAVEQWMQQNPDGQKCATNDTSNNQDESNP